MAKKTVLAIGIDPSVVDFSALSGLTAELVRNYIDAQIERLRSLGFEAESYLIDLMVSALNGVGSPDGRLRRRTLYELPHGLARWRAG